MFKIGTLIMSYEEALVLLKEDKGVTTLFKQEDLVKVAYKEEDKTKYIRGTIHTFSMGTITIDDGDYLNILELDKVKSIENVKTFKVVK